MKSVVLMMIVVVCVGFFALGCNKQFIPNTEIEDTPFNRDVIAFSERYRHAIEKLNVGLLISLSSPRYFDNAGTPSPDDDIDQAGLKEVLSEKLSKLKAMRYEIKYRDVYEEHGIICIDYTYTMSFQYKVGEKIKWENTTADNRLELEKVDGGFLILTGM